MRPGVPGLRPLPGAVPGPRALGDASSDVPKQAELWDSGCSLHAPPGFHTHFLNCCRLCPWEALDRLASLAQTKAWGEFWLPVSVHLCAVGLPWGRVGPVRRSGLCRWGAAPCVGAPDRREWRRWPRWAATAPTRTRTPGCRARFIAVASLGPPHSIASAPFARARRASALLRPG